MFYSNIFKNIHWSELIIYLGFNVLTADQPQHSPEFQQYFLCSKEHTEKGYQINIGTQTRTLDEIKLNVY